MSCTVDKKDKIWRFELQSQNTGEKTITDPLLDTEARALERANSEFLQHSYPKRSTSFRSWKTDLKINDIISLSGIPWLVKSMSFSIDSKSIVTTVGVVRYG